MAVPIFTNPFPSVPDVIEIVPPFLAGILHGADPKPYLHLSEDDFQFADYAAIWRVIRGMYDKGQSVSVPAVLAHLNETGSLEGNELAQRCRAVAAAYMGDFNLQTYAELIREYAQRRRLQGIALELATSAADLELPPDELLARMVGELHRVSADGPRKGATKREVAERLVKSLDMPKERFPTGLASLDAAMGGGIYAGRMYAMAARKKVGKTILLGTISHNLSLASIPHLFLAAETPADEIEMRNAAREGRFNSIRFLKGDDSNLPNRVAEYAINQGHTTIYEDIPGATFDQLRSIIGRHLAAGKIRGIVLDYLQLIGGKSKSDTEEYHLRSIAQWLADLARRESLFVLIAAQVNQDGNTRGGEGLRLACDQYYTLHRDQDDDAAWLEMGESRYTLYRNIGSEAVPGLILDKHGPHFRDAAEQRRDGVA